MINHQFFLALSSSCFRHLCPLAPVSTSGLKFLQNYYWIQSHIYQPIMIFVSLKTDKSVHLEESTCSTCHRLLMCCVQLLPWLARRWFSSRPWSFLPSTLTQSYHIKVGDKWPPRSWHIITPHHNASQRIMTAQRSSEHLVQARTLMHASLINHNWRLSVGYELLGVQLGISQVGRYGLLGQKQQLKFQGKEWMDLLLGSHSGPMIQSCPTVPNMVHNVRRYWTWYWVSGNGWNSWRIT